VESHELLLTLQTQVVIVAGGLVGVGILVGVEEGAHAI
jgi:hypothetical protein